MEYRCYESFSKNLLLSQAKHLTFFFRLGVAISKKLQTGHPSPLIRVQIIFERQAFYIADINQSSFILSYPFKYIFLSNPFALSNMTAQSQTESCLEYDKKKLGLKVCNIAL